MRPRPRLASLSFMLLPLRHPRFWLVLGWCFVVLATISGLLPSDRLPRVPVVNDKIEHAATYAMLTLWFAGIYPRSRYFIIAICLLALGLLVEWAQGAMHLGRTADLRDVIANCVGIVAGLLLATTWLGGWAQRVEGWTRHT
jgi:VanZ family protein